MRRTVLIVHLVCSVGWIGGALAYLVLGVAALRSQDADGYTAMWVAMELVGWRALVPLAVGSLVTGVALALVTPWGLLQHYWVVVSLVVTMAATAVLVQHMVDVSSVVTGLRSGAVAAHPGGDLGHTLGGLAVLVAVTVLNVVKPRGVTRRGWRAQQRRREVARGSHRAAASSSRPGPRPTA